VAPASFHAAFKRRLWDARRPAGCEDALSTHSADEAERLFHGIVAKMCGVNSDKRLLLISNTSIVIRHITLPAEGDTRI
jgi:hypothetical protein